MTSRTWKNCESCGDQIKSKSSLLCIKCQETPMRADELLRRVVLCRAWEKLDRSPKSDLVRSEASKNLWAQVDEYLAMRKRLDRDKQRHEEDKRKNCDDKSS